MATADTLPLRPVLVIFLDCDGVLNHRALYAANELRRGETSPTDWIDRACVVRLNRLLARTGALVVISSSWRTYTSIPGTTVGGWRGVAEVLAACGLVPGVVIDGTPDHGAELPVRARRWGEIRAWLDVHPEVDDYVVLDDLPLDDALPWQFVCTDIERGLTDLDVDRAVRILGEACRG